MTDSPTTLHPLTTRGILDRAIRLYRSNVLKFIVIVLLVKGPYLILENLLMNLIESLAAVFLVKLLEPLLIVPILTAVMAIAISEHLLGRDIEIGEAYRRILEKGLPLLGTILLSGIIIGIGSMILIPGLFLWVWFAFIPQTVMIEAEGGVSAMKRSKYLVKGYFARAFTLLVLIFVATSLFTGAISYGVTKFLPISSQYSSALGTGAANVISVILEPFKIAVMVLLYYDFRVKKEGFDLEIMASELESELE